MLVLRHRLVGKEYTYGDYTVMRLNDTEVVAKYKNGYWFFIWLRPSNPSGYECIDALTGASVALPEYLWDFVSTFFGI
jgi:hypothetical protein